MILKEKGKGTGYDPRRHILEKFSVYLVFAEVISFCSHKDIIFIRVHTSAVRFFPNSQKLRSLAEAPWPKCSAVTEKNKADGSRAKKTNDRSRKKGDRGERHGGIGRNQIQESKDSVEEG